MKSLSPAEQLAEVPETPVHIRLSGALRDLGNIVENQTVEVMATDDVYFQAQRLRYWLDVQLDAAGRQRDLDGCDPLVYEPPPEIPGG